METPTKHKRVILETGLFVRIQRGEEWQNLDIGALNPAELSEFFAQKERHELINWIVFFVGSLMGQACRIVEEEET
jgi:hypothetical protein